LGDIYFILFRQKWIILFFSFAGVTTIQADRFKRILTGVWCPAIHPALLKAAPKRTASISRADASTPVTIREICLRQIRFAGQTTGAD
jgi:hypothetical protein